MLLRKWDVSAAIHIHVILADINRDDECFLLGARVSPTPTPNLGAWGRFFTVGVVVVVVGRTWWKVKTYGLITLARCQPIFLSCRPALRSRSSYVSLRTDLQDEDKCGLSMAHSSRPVQNWIGKGCASLPNCCILSMQTGNGTLIVWKIKRFRLHALFSQRSGRNCLRTDNLC